MATVNIGWLLSLAAMTSVAACSLQEHNGNDDGNSASSALSETTGATLTQGSLSTAGNATCVLREDNTIWCWGSGSHLGDGIGVSRIQAEPVVGLPDSHEAATAPTQIALGGNGACSRHRDGRMFCWGNNRFGQVGDGTSTNRRTPVLIPGLGSGGNNQVASVDPGGNFTCAVKLDRTLWCWGFNWQGQLGDGTTTSRRKPVQVAALGNQVAAVSASNYHACAIKLDGTLWCWGNNGAGELGDGTTTSSLNPVQVTALGNKVVSVVTGDLFTCAREADNTLWCWGNNSEGAVGNGQHLQPTDEQRVKSPVQVTTLGHQVLGVAAGANHACAVLLNGTVWCWGRDIEGELGIGGGYSSPDKPGPQINPTPMMVSLPGPALRLFAGNMNTFAQLADGSVWGWGYNYRGQIGDGTTIDRFAPVRMTAALAPGNGRCDFSESKIFEPQDCH